MVRLRHKWILEKAGIPHIRFEDLRHTCAVLALQSGITAAKLTHLQGRCHPMFTRQSYAEYLEPKQAQQSTVEAQNQQNEQQQAAQMLDSLLSF